MVYRYIPVVRTKAGEADALGNLTPLAKSKVFPLIRLTGAVPVTFLSRMQNLASGLPMALDGQYNTSVTGSSVAYTSLFNGLGTSGFPVIPVLTVSLSPSSNYNSAAAAPVGAYSAGFLLHVPLGNLPSLTAWLAHNPAWIPSDIDLLIDVGDVSTHNIATYAAYLTHAIGSQVPAGHGWRSVALHAWSAPKDHGPLSTGRNDVARNDWRIWDQVRSIAPFQLDYSDSGHVHPSLDEVPGYAMANATVSVRYAIDDRWIIHKGVQTSGAHGIDMQTQYRAHAHSLSIDPSFGGVPGCWGDARILHYAATTGGAGGRPQWAALLLNRHISLVADRLP